jgi:hypothetical protein
VELTLPEGSSKGQEQFALFQMVCVSLLTEEVRVVVTRCGIVHPESPMVTMGLCLYLGFAMQYHCGNDSARRGHKLP